jgi:GntR family transcriptional regulator, transcriptional repressor for pyruvate dehydrogenase complex
MSHTLYFVSLSEDRVKMRQLHRDIYEAMVRRDRQRAMHAIDAHFDWLNELNASSAMLDTTK